ncbi:MAG TPA: VWA domain-containing protein [Solirubrobacteraceae bacterium]|nr:VWA domain-containing protein [Solirubrobacteraceae bacterium]
MRRPPRIALLAAAVLAAGASSATGAAPAQLALTADGRFPARTLVVSGLRPGRLPRDQVRLFENGQPVPVESVAPARSGRRGDLGVMLVIDRSDSMRGAASADALRAARSLAGERMSNQSFGIVTFNSTAAVDLPMTSSSAAIGQALRRLPPLAVGTRILPALQLAIRQFAAARIAAGAVILLSDGADLEPMHPLTPRAIAAQARAAHVQIFTVGIRDRSYTPASMRGLARIGGGQFTQVASGAELRNIFSRIQSGLASSWLIRYRSRQPLGRRVSVTLRLPGARVLTVTYLTPHVPRPIARARASDARRSFWASPLALALVVGVCALLLSIPVWLFVRRRSGPGTVAERVGGFLSPAGESSPPVVSLASTASRHTRATFSRSAWWPAFTETVDIAMIAHPPETLIVRAGAIACLVGALVWLVLGSVPAAVLPLLAAPFALRTYVQVRVRAQRGRFSELLPSHLEEVAVAIRAGRSLVEAMNVVAQGAEEPMRREFERALRDEHLGRPLEDTLRVISERMASESMEQLAVVAAMHRRTGSSVSEAIDRIAEGARERADLQRELRTLTAQGRLARWMLTLLPPVILLTMEVISPTYVRPLLDTTAGLASLGVAAVMVIAGSLVMKRIVNIEE